jgi:hypothetical protein
MTSARCSGEPAAVRSAEDRSGLHERRGEEGARLGASVSTLRSPVSGGLCARLERAR